MLRFAILREDIRGLRIVNIKGKDLEWNKNEFYIKLIREINSLLPDKGRIFKRKKWDISEIDRAVNKALENVEKEMKRETVKMR